MEKSCSLKLSKSEFNGIHEWVTVFVVNIGDRPAKGRHDNVRRTIEMLHQQSAISCPQIEGGIKSANGVVEKVYLVNKRDRFVVVAKFRIQGH